MNSNENKKKAVIYCRVSTKEQVEEGNSLITQERICRDYCLRNHLEMVEVFIEQGESAKTADRTELNKMLKLCEAKKNGIQAVVVYRLDRLSRNTDDYSQLRIKLKRYGVEIRSTTEHFEDNPVGRFMENTMANIAQFDNDVRAERCTNGMKEAIKEGRYVWLAPIGYNNVKIASKANIEPDPILAPLVHQTFELIAKNIYSIQEIQKIMVAEGLSNKKGNPIARGYFYRMFTNPMYAGWIVKFGEKKKGIFEPIVSDELFNQVQAVLKARGRKLSHYMRDNPDFPLRRFIKNEQGLKLTGSWSKGRTKPYPYYRFKDKGLNYSKAEMENLFMDFLKNFTFDENKIKALKDYIKVHLVKSTQNIVKERDRLQNYISELQQRETGIIEKNFKGVISDKVLTVQTEFIEKERESAYLKLSNMPDTQYDYQESLLFLKKYLKNPSKIWEKSGLRVRTRLQWFQFPEGLVLQNNFFGTTKMCLLYKLRNGNSGENSLKVDSRNEFWNHLKITNHENNESTKDILSKQLGKEIETLTEILKSSDEYLMQ